VKKFSSVCFVLCPLLVAASCASDEQSPPDSPDGDFTGIEEATQGLSDLSTQCSFIKATGFAVLALATGDVAVVSKLPNGALGVNGYPCSTATTAALKKLTVTGTGGVQTLILDFYGGVFGAGTAAGVGLDVNLGAGADSFKIRGTKAADTYVFGATPVGALGVAINTDAFKDIAVTGTPLITVTMGDGSDNFSGAGNIASGGPIFVPFPLDVTVYGGNGNDTIRGGSGDDTLDGGLGDDTFTTGASPDGDDKLLGGGGNDTADYSLRTAVVTLKNDGALPPAPLTGTASGELGASTPEADIIASDIHILKGGKGNDVLTGTANDDTLYGGPGNDTITGGLGNDTLFGDAGNDTFLEGSSTTAPNGADVINGGAGVDTVSYAGRTHAVIVTLDSVAHSGEAGELDKVMVDVENVTGGSVDDTITGSAVDNVLDGGPGNDTIYGGAGNDTLIGGTSLDVSVSVLGYNTLHGDDGDDTFPQGLETFVTAARAGTLVSVNDIIVGGNGVDTVDYSGRTNRDLIVGTIADDLIFLRVVMDGVTPSGEKTGSTNTSPAGANVQVEGDLIGTDVENLIGGTGADLLTGNAGNNQIEGGAGIDTINGLDGDDTIDGGLGVDVVDCGLGDGDMAYRDGTGSNASCEL
jgi:Ca2+-binding RTX toxin-like protein